MKPTQIEFRLRLIIMVVIVYVGFWSPWIEGLGIGRRISLTEWLALEISRMGLLSFTAATPAVIVLGSLIAAVGAVLRVWGTAYLGSGTVNSPQMKADIVLAAGPYRYVRNPLYLGSWFMFAAMAFILPPTGALLTMVLLTVFLYRLILGEEAFLTAKLGEPYRAYLNTVPRLFPRLRTTLPTSSAQPAWFRSMLSEINPIGVFITIAVFSWSYNHWLMVQAILVSFGLSIVARALVPGIKPQLA
jgi:protein-S-isoprenylcysteine O-methyltransferase Ste14